MQDIARILKGQQDWGGCRTEHCEQNSSFIGNPGQSGPLLTDRCYARHGEAVMVTAQSWGVLSGSDLSGNADAFDLDPRNLTSAEDLSYCGPVFLSSSHGLA